MIQLQLLNKILQDGDASIITLNNLDESFFSDYVGEFRFIRTHLDQYGKVPDQFTFLSTFRDFDVVEVRETSKYLLDELYRDKNKRELAKTFNRVKDLLNQDKVDEAMNLYINATDNITQAVHLESIDILRDTSRYDAYIERSTDFTKFYVKTGFKELDEIIGGWDRQEELATIIARPNVGKSWILLKVAIAAAQQGLNVGLYSGEMSERKVGYRVDTLISHLSNTKLIHGNRDIQNEYKVFLDNLSNEIPGSIRVLTPQMINGAAGVNALRAFIEKEKLDILCIDQHSLLEDDRNARDPVTKAANISRDLKNLQVLKHIPIIAVSQGNRGISENGTLGLENIAQSDRIGQDSTVVIGLEQKDGVLSLHLLKSRDSVNGKVLKYNLDFDKGHFVFIPTENDATGGARCDEERSRYGDDYDTGTNEF